MPASLRRRQQSRQFHFVAHSCYRRQPSFTCDDGDDLFPVCVEEVDAAGTLVARYTQGLGIDEPMVMLRGANSSYYQQDGLGTVTSLSDASGSLAQTYVFDSFGNQTASSGSLTNSFRYTGREFDAETGLYYYRARYYDPTIGRFISEDSIRFKAGTISTATLEIIQ